MYRLDKAKADYRRVSQKLAALEGQRDLLLQQREAAEGRQEAAEAMLGTYDLVQILLEKTSTYARQQSKTRMEEIVTQALSIVFHDKNYKFFMKLEKRANRSEVDYYLQEDEVITQLKPPDYDNGGGVVDVISAALRLAVGELCGVKGPLFLDEIGKHVSQEYAPNFAYFLKEYSQKFGRQIILNTHNQHLADIGDVSIGVRKIGAFSEVTVL